MNLISIAQYLKNSRVGSNALRCGYSTLRWLHYGRVVVTERHGIRYKLDLSENIDSSLYLRGVYERWTSLALRQHITPDMIVIEVGANIGAHTFEIASLLNKGQGIVYSFEPTNYAFTKLKQNYGLNNFENIVLEQIALADCNGTRTIHRATSPETLPFRASWDIRTKAVKDHAVDEITFETLDHYCERKELTRLDLLKIDVDGYEARVLKGARETLTRHRPILIIELGTTVERLGDSLDAVVKTLLNLGYHIRPVDCDAPVTIGELLEMVKRKRTLDCVCLPPV